MLAVKTIKEWDDNEYWYFYSLEENEKKEGEQVFMAIDVESNLENDETLEFIFYLKKMTNDYFRDVPTKSRYILSLEDCKEDGLYFRRVKQKKSNLWTTTRRFFPAAVIDTRSEGRKVEELDPFIFPFSSSFVKTMRQEAIYAHNFQLARDEVSSVLYCLPREVIEIILSLTQ